MVKLLTVNSRMGLPLPRTETVDSEPEGLLGAVHVAQQWCACCQRRAQAPRATSFDQSFSLPREDDLVEELREPTVNEMQQAPEKVVLLPVKLVLKWFEKIVAWQREVGLLGGF